MTAPLPLPLGVYACEAGDWKTVYSGDQMREYAAANIAALTEEVRQVREAYDNRTRDWYAQSDAMEQLKRRVEELEAEKDAAGNAAYGALWDAWST